MKNITPLAALGLALICQGCASGLADRAALQITTNYVPQIHVIERVVTNIVERPVTNVVRELVPDSGTTNVIERTNVVMVPIVERTTNTVTVTNLVPASVEVTPRPAITTSVGVAGSLFGPWGTFAGVALTGLLGLYARARERRINAQLAGQVVNHTDANIVLAESVEVARELLKNTPQGQAVEAKYLNWLKTHQKASGVLSTVTEVVAEHVDNSAARGIAALIRPPQS